MGLFARPQAVSINDERVWEPSRVGLVSRTGMPVSAESMMGISAVWACTRLISQSLGAVPLICYERIGEDGRRRAPQFPLYTLLHDQPNAAMTAFEFKRLLTLHALLRGNGYARILPGPRGPVDRLIPIHPDRVTPEPIDDERLRYRVKRRGQPDEILLDDEMFHLVGLSWDGRTGVSVVEYARETMGLALATEAHGAHLFGRGISLAGVVEVPRDVRLNAAGAQNLRDDVEAQHAGLGNAHSVLVLADGAQWKPMGLSSEDSQFLETRQFQVAEVARWFGVDLTLIQENTKSSSWGTGIEQLLRAFVTFTLLPWATAWEQAISRDLIVAPQRFFAEYLLDSLVRADLLLRYQAHGLSIRDGWKTRNEVRRIENYNPEPGLDGFILPLNMQTVEDSAPPPASRPAASGHYRRLLAESADRVIRKETAALNRAAARCGNDLVAWTQAVEQFYSDHAAFVAAALAMPPARAELWSATQQLALVQQGPGPVDGLMTGRAERLMELAKESWQPGDGCQLGREA